MATNNASVSRWRYAAGLVLFTALTAYLSLYPWRSGRMLPAGDPWALLFSTHWFRLGLRFTSDVVLNIIFYLPFGVFGVWSLPAHWTWWKRVLPVLAAGFALSLAIEVTQFDYRRVTSPVDLATNTTGVLLGAFLASLLQRTKSWQVKVGPALLLSCLIVYALLAYRLDLPLWQPGALVLAATALWLFLGMIQPKIFARPPALVFFTLLTGALIWEELRPFHPVMTMAPFEWTPFIASLNGSSLGAGAVFSRKLFHSGAMLFAALCGRLPFWIATLSLAGILLLLEHMQRFLPGRTPESTDAVLVLLWAVILKLVMPSRVIV